MYTRLFAAFFALHVLAVSQTPADWPPLQDSDLLTAEELQNPKNIDFLSEAMIDILFNTIIRNDTLSPDTISRRSTDQVQQYYKVQIVRREFRISDAREIAKIPFKGNRAGVFYRGDNRPPSVIFREGFVPPGSNLNFYNHLAFASGDSAYVAVTRSRPTAQAYAFGRSNQKTKIGYIYVMSPANMPPGVWVPGAVRPNPSVTFNQEFAVRGRIVAQSISHAYEILDTDQRNPKYAKKILNPVYEGRFLPSCFYGSVGSRKVRRSGGGACDPVRSNRYKIRPLANGRFAPRVSHKIRVGGSQTGKAGRAVLFGVLAMQAHTILNTIKSLDNPIGWAVSWVDDAIATLQQRIGGEQVPTIHGNALKLSIICAGRGQQQFPNRVDKDCERWRGDAPDEQPPRHPGRNERLFVMNRVLNKCDENDSLETRFEDEDAAEQLDDECDTLRTQVARMAC